MVKIGKQNTAFFQGLLTHYQRQEKLNKTHVHRGHHPVLSERLKAKFKSQMALDYEFYEFMQAKFTANKFRFKIY